MRYVLGVCTLVVAGAWIVGAAPVAAGGGGCHQQTEGAGSTVQMEGFCFTPTVLRVDPGTTVTWENADPVEHVVTGTGWAAMDALAPGEEASHTFDSPGAYAYACYLHPGMNGVVLVGNVDAGPNGPAPEASGAGGADRSALLGVGGAGVALGAVGGTAGRHAWLRRRTTA